MVSSSGTFQPVDKRQALIHRETRLTMQCNIVSDVYSQQTDKSLSCFLKNVNPTKITKKKNLLFSRTEPNAILVVRY